MSSKLIDKAKASLATFVGLLTGQKRGLHVFVANYDGVAEYVIAHNQDEAFAFLTDLWGAACMKEYIDEFRRDEGKYYVNESGIENAFIAGFIRKFPDDAILTINDVDEHNDRITKTGKQWADGAGTVCWLCAEG